MFREEGGGEANLHDLEPSPSSMLLVHFLQSMYITRMIFIHQSFVRLFAFDSRSGNRNRVSHYDADVSLVGARRKVCPMKNRLADASSFFNDKSKVKKPVVSRVKVGHSYSKDRNESRAVAQREAAVYAVRQPAHNFIFSNP